MTTDNFYIGNPNHAFTEALILRNVVKIVHEYTDGYQKYEVVNKPVFEEMYALHYEDI